MGLIGTYYNYKCDVCGKILTDPKIMCEITLNRKYPYSSDISRVLNKTVESEKCLEEELDIIKKIISAEAFDCFKYELVVETIIPGK